MSLCSRPAREEFDRSLYLSVELTSLFYRNAHQGPQRLATQSHSQAAEDNGSGHEQVRLLMLPGCRALAGFCACLLEVKPTITAI